MTPSTQHYDWLSAEVAYRREGLARARTPRGLTRRFRRSSAPTCAPAASRARLQAPRTA